MLMPDWIVLVSRRRQERVRLAAWKVAGERAAVQRAATQREYGFGDESQVVPAQGDLICFMVAVRPC
jgi:hypothetical protein